MIEAVILCGGKGTRLRSAVPHTQKVVAEVQEQPFLFFIIDELVKQKVERIILCVGYRSDDVILAIKQKYKNNSVNIDFSIEDYPLGTGGAVNLAQNICKGNDILVLNGDTFNEFSVRELVEFHQLEKNNVTILVKSAPSASRYGLVTIDTTKNVLSFTEKDPCSDKPGLVNAGVYIFSKTIFKKIDEQVYSLEESLLPKIIGNKIKALFSEGIFIDIGVPEDYEKANKINLGQ